MAEKAAVDEVRRSPRSFPLNLTWYVLQLLFFTWLFCATGKCEQQGVKDYEIPEICTGENPVRYLGIATTRGREAAEQSLGRKLYDADLEMISIYATLQLGNVTYAPGHCPGQGYQAVSSSPSQNSSVSLAYVYAKPGSFSRTFLSLQAPARQLSLGSLSKRVAWRANDEQTLRFEVPDDQFSLQCWQASGPRQRQAFIHRLLNITLSDIAQAARPHTFKWLTGTIFVRGQAISGLWPFSFGGTFFYIECDQSFLPVDVLNSSTLNFTACSQWTKVSSSVSWLPSSAALVLNVCFAIACFIVFFYSWPWLNGKWYRDLFTKYRPTFTSCAKFEVRNIMSGRHSRDGSRTYFIRDFKYPEQLKVGFLTFTPKILEVADDILKSNTQEKTFNRALKKARGYHPQFLLVCFLLLSILGALFGNVAIGAMLDQRFDSTSNLWSPCTMHGFSIYVIICTCIVVSVIVPLLLTYLYDRHRLQENDGLSFKEKQALIKRGYQHQPNDDDASTICRYWLTVIASFALSLLVPLFFMPVLANIVLSAGFLTAGLAVYYTSVLLTFAAFFKVVLVDIFSLYDLNRILCPNIALCKEACDTASLELSQEAISYQSSKLCHGTDEHDGVVGPLLRGAEGILGPSAHTGLVAKLDACSTRAFLLLCSRFGIVSWVPERDEKGNCIPKSKHDQVYRKIWALLVVRIFRRLRQFMLRATLKTIGMLTVFILAEYLLLNVGELAKAGFWSSVILPGVVLLQTLYKGLTTKTTDLCSAKAELVVEAKRLLVLLVTKLGEELKANSGTGAVKLDHEEKSKAGDAERERNGETGDENDDEGLHDLRPLCLAEAASVPAPKLEEPSLFPIRMRQRRYHNTVLTVEDEETESDSSSEEP